MSRKNVNQSVKIIANEINTRETQASQIKSGKCEIHR